MKSQALADHVAENPVEDEYQPLSTYFPDEEVNLVEHYTVIARLWFFYTNNTTEYEACIMGMNMEIDQEVEELLIMGDLDLIIRQAQGEWETQNVKLIPYIQHVEDLSKQFKSVEFRHGYCGTVEIEPDVQPWYHDIKRFLKTKEYPEQIGGDQKRTIRRLSSGFFLSGEVLYKRTPNLNLIRCVDAQEAGRIMNEVHAGVCGPHMNGYVLVHGDLIHALPLELHPMSAPWLFVAWGMDVIGPIEPKASNVHRFILVAIDYFTKWVEAVTLKVVTKKEVVDFVHANIICRFGIPKTIITDNAANLNNHLKREICEQFKITHQDSTPYLPQANGAVEATNKNIKKIIRKMIQSSRQWHEKLSFALLGYHTTVRTSVGATPYILVYGTDTVIPAEVDIPSLRIIVEAEVEDSE
ncbi:uncharacterized protein [Nicotiana sylvestris]|uniref:uncharacterized protein n=1 Tax=Nicotiana sylvestris TaxID=4096 RepID=UPI00388CEB89